MQTTQTLQIVLMIAAIAVCAVAVYALIEFIKTARSARLFAEESRVRIIPLLDKVDITVDAANAELLRIDGIVTQFEEVSSHVSSTTSAVKDAVHAPMDAVNAVSTGLRGAYSTWRREHRST